MKKFYLVNYKTIETAYFNTSKEAFEEAQRRNKADKKAKIGLYFSSLMCYYGTAMKENTFGGT